MNFIHKVLITLSCALPVLCLAGNVKATGVICPLKSDAPQLIDGNPKEWQSLPGTIEISGEQNSNLSPACLRAAWNIPATRYWTVIRSFIFIAHRISSPLMLTGTRGK